MWTEELIKSELLKVSKHIGNNLMPTRNEIHDFYGNDKLTNKISKTLGYYGWAKKLGLTVQNSDTTKAKRIERQVANLLATKGFKAEQMVQNFAYDLLVDGVVKVDVKFSNLYRSPAGYGFYSFALRKKHPTCDIYILAARNENGEEKFYIVPSFKANQLQISIGEHNSIYDQYIDCYGLISQYRDSITAIA